MTAGPEPIYFEREIMVPMADGARLATDIYWPSQAGERKDGAFPVLLERTPYNKLSTHLVRSAKYFAAHDYVVALQDVRGRWGSDGEWEPFRHEGRDGRDAIQWLADQDWCSGQVATCGLSYSACTQTAAAALAPRGLAAQTVSQGYHNYHEASMRHGGALEMRWFCYAFRLATTSRTALADPVARRALEEAYRNLPRYLDRAPLKAGATPLALVPTYEAWLLEIGSQGAYAPYWSDVPAYSVSERYDDHADVPILFLGSWYDSYCRSTVENYVQLEERKKGPIRLIMGPWTHGVDSVELSHAGDIELGPDAAINYDHLRRQWFDAVVKGRDEGILAEPAVKIFVMGGGSGRKTPDGRLDHGGGWRHEQEWPLSRAEEERFYLRRGGRLTAAAPGSDEAPSRYTFDPHDPVPTVGGNLSAAPSVMPGGGFDQRGRPDVYGAADDLPLAARHDVLVFTTAPLARDVEVTGTVTVHLWVASSAVDTDFTAKLIDLYPPNDDYPQGYALNIGDAITRMRYRQDPNEAHFMEPGELYRATITLYPTSNLFQAGHRIQLHVSSSNYPRFDVNPNTGGPLGAGGSAHSARQTVYHDAARPSHVVLPVVPQAGT